MSVSAGLEVRLLRDGKNAMDIVDCLLGHGWRIYDNGQKVFLPINDDGMFDWQREVGITDDEVINILKAKNNAHEPLGVSLSWLDTNIGGEFIIHQDLSLLFSCSNHRKINCYGITDFDWYFSKIIPIFNSMFSIESFGFSQDN